jgi:hypothetical protein
MTTRTKHVQLEGTHGLTLLEVKAVVKAINSTLARNSQMDEDVRSLTAKETNTVYNALEKLLTAIEWHQS